MFTIRLNYKKIAIVILVLIQMCVIVHYLYEPHKKQSNYLLDEKISFVSNKVNLQSSNHTYHTIKDTITLGKTETRVHFIDFNSSVCYINGTDVKNINKNDHLVWNCQCLNGWHGKDCGQPEVIWRAFLTYKKSIEVSGPRTYARRVVYIFKINKFLENLADVRINELKDVVDLFILLGDETYAFAKSSFLTNLKKMYYHKILYMNGDINEKAWSIINNVIEDLALDDVILISQKDEIPHKYAINFLKYYENWPEPIRFRLRWSVFGFFWKHPQKTQIRGVATTVSYIKKNLDNDFTTLIKNNGLTNTGYKDKSIILGDLNHFGGWYCEFCIEAPKISEYLYTIPESNHIKWEILKTDKVDTNYIEELIENGIYIDGKTELHRSRKYQDNYFAPFYVLNNSWKYDYLLINMYSKLDYYEG